MKSRFTLGFAICAALLLTSSSALGQVLYSENFDDGQASTRWTAQAGKGYDTAYADAPMDTNFDNSPFPPDGVNDDLSGFAYDYSVAGIPSAPGSSGTTIGLKLQANQFFGTFGGVSANPNNLDLNALAPSGNYSVKFQAWSSMVGGSNGFPAGGDGTTMLSTFGILSAGTMSQVPLQIDGVTFSYTLDGGSASDFRAYSSEDTNSYDGSAGEPHGIYHAGSRNNTAALYADALGPGTVVPQSVKDAFPLQNLEGTTQAGTPAFQWVANEIRKEGNLVDWYVNGVKLVTVDMTEFATPTLGGNITFGHSDTNWTPSTDPEALNLMFTLIDNIEVTAISASVDNADFNGDGNVDGRDFLTWQRGFGTPDAQLADGDANGDHAVDGNDLVVWQGQYGGSTLAAVSVVPEPATIGMLMGVALLVGLRRRG
jgi:hypothetical protein